MQSNIPGTESRYIPRHPCHRDPVVVIDRRSNVGQFIDIDPTKSVVASLQSVSCRAIGGISSLRGYNIAVNAITFLQIDLQPILPGRNLVVIVQGKAGV